MNRTQMLNSTCNPRTRRVLLGLVATTLLGCMAAGCAAVSNPVANGLPVRRLPDEILGQPREEEQTIPLTWLRQEPPTVYRLAPGDILAVWVDEILGSAEQLPRVNLTNRGTASYQLPSIGFPIPVRENGTISLPIISPIQVAGSTIAEVERQVRQTYLVQNITKPETRVFVELLRPRTYNVLVVRQDTGGVTLNAAGSLGGTKRGTGFIVNLPAYENDVLNALAKTGGLPGLDALNEVVILRGTARDSKVMPDLRSFGGANNQKSAWPPDAMTGQNRAPSGSMSIEGTEVVRIPLRLRPGDRKPFSSDEVILNTGDIVFIEARDSELFYTGGLLPIGEHVLPRDYDLDIVEAVARVGGPIVNGGFNSGNFATGTVVGGGIGNPTPSLVTVLRRTPGGGQIPIRIRLDRAIRDPRERILVQPGDVIILQETFGEAMARYFTQQFNFGAIFRVINRTEGQGTITTALP